MGLPTLTPNQIEQIARIMGDTDKGFSGTEIEHNLAQCRINDPNPGITKWKRVFNAFCDAVNDSGRDLDSLDYEDKHYQRRKNDLEDRLYRTYNKMDEMEDLLVDAKAKKRSILAEKVSGENIYKALIFFR